MDEQKSTCTSPVFTTHICHGLQPMRHSKGLPPKGVGWVLTRSCVRKWRDYISRYLEIIAVSKQHLHAIYIKLPFGRGTTPLRGLTDHGYWPLTSPGMILQVPPRKLTWTFQHPPWMEMGISYWKWLFISFEQCWFSGLFCATIKQTTTTRAFWKRVPMTVGLMLDGSQKSYSEFLDPPMEGFKPV